MDTKAQRPSIGSTISSDNSSAGARRFGREKRKSMILDSAAVLIAEKGTADLSLEAIGEVAGVSKTLMYRYFGSLVELLTQLLNREYRHLRSEQLMAAEEATTYEDLVRRVTRAYLFYIEERGLIVERLQAYPNIAQAQDPTHYDREPSVFYFSEVTAEVFDLPTEVATAATEISFGLPAAAGEFLVRSGMDRQLIEDITVSMILGSIAGLRNDALGRQLAVRSPSEVLALPTPKKAVGG
ncbi:MAG: TetR/AcrR family transcriptional regulator [Pseudomonadota bacterium]